ncbi:MAG: RNA polymerase sigma factor FliA [Myxococcales bacterium]|nr:RNA polymerase sigma factor FliA [Myxococcales bacterium]
MPMVRRIAMRLVRRLPSHITVADLVSAGWVGVMEACSRADAEMPDEEFAAYASLRVRGAMLDYLRQLDPATRQARNASRKIARAISDQTQALGRVPEEEEVADALGLAVDDYRTLLEKTAARGMTRIDMVDFDKLDAFPAEVGHTDQVAENRMMAEAVAKAIDALPERLRLVLALYYQESCTLREIGAVLEVSESRACQLHSEAVHRLRAALGRE